MLKTLTLSITAAALLSGLAFTYPAIANDADLDRAVDAGASAFYSDGDSTTVAIPPALLKRTLF